VEKVNLKAANLLKQTMLSKGGEAAVARGVADLSADYSDILLIGTLRQFRQALDQLSRQPWGLSAIARELNAVLELNHGRNRTFVWGQRRLEIGRKTLIMGVLNITPDSFSDGGRYNDLDLAIKQAHRMVAEGADIIDIGGESTRPYGNNQPISAEQEMERVLPILEKLLPEIPVPISLDTYKAATAKSALELGVHMINDVWGLQKDPAMAGVIAEYEAPVVVMHNKSEPGYHDLMGEINHYLRQSIQIAENAGIPRERVIVDPGIGFGKTKADNLRIIRHLREIEVLGCPILLGTSRKSFIGTTLDLPPTDRVEGTAATIAIGIANGANIVRVHDIKEMVRVAQMADAVMREEVR
jgi:dihydropteroate synthase